MRRLLILGFGQNELRHLKFLCNTAAGELVFFLKAYVSKMFWN